MDRRRSWPHRDSPEWSAECREGISSDMYACIHSALSIPHSALLECARGFSPTAELADAETVVFSIGGLGLLYGSIEAIAQAIADRVSRAGLEANIAVAHNADA